MGELGISGEDIRGHCSEEIEAEKRRTSRRVKAEALLLGLVGIGGSQFQQHWDVLKETVSAYYAEPAPTYQLLHQPPLDITALMRGNLTNYH